MPFDEERELRLPPKGGPLRVSKKPFEMLLDEALAEVREMLIRKNKLYGNSVLEPVRVFSRAGVREQIRVRMDDKLSRIENQQPGDDEDPQRDLLGYLILDCIAERLGHD